MCDCMVPIRHSFQNHPVKIERRSLTGQMTPDGVCVFNTTKVVNSPYNNLTIYGASQAQYNIENNQKSVIFTIPRYFTFSDRLLWNKKLLIPKMFICSCENSYIHVHAREFNIELCCLFFAACYVFASEPQMYFNGCMKATPTTDCKCNQAAVTQCVQHHFNIINRLGEHTQKTASLSPILLF